MLPALGNIDLSAMNEGHKSMTVNKLVSPYLANSRNPLEPKAGDATSIDYSLLPSAASNGRVSQYWTL